MKTLVKNSIVGKARAEKRGIVAEVLDLLDWTAEIYCDCHWSVYEDFFAERFAGYPVVMAQVMASPVMHGFWRKEEIKRAMVLLDFINDLKSDKAYVTDSGELVMNKGVEHPADYWIEYYTYYNDANSLLHNENFMAGFEQVLNIIIESK